MAEGAHGSLRSTVPPMTGPAWTSFATGVNPGKHRLYDWIAREPDSYRFLPVTALDCRAPTIYALLSQAGRRVCALNIPMTYPPLPVNGVVVSGLPAPSTKVKITYPDTLLDELNAATGEYLLYPDPGQAYSDSGVDAFLERLYKTTDGRLRTLDYLRGREDWDFTMVVFNGTDTISHAMWKLWTRTIRCTTRARPRSTAMPSALLSVPGRQLAGVVDVGRGHDADRHVGPRFRSVPQVHPCQQLADAAGLYAGAQRRGQPHQAGDV